MRIKTADLKKNFCSRVLAAFLPSLAQGETSDCHMLLRMIGETKKKVSGDRFRCFFVVFLYVTKVFSELRSPSRLPISPMYNSLQRAQVMQ